MPQSKLKLQRLLCQIHIGILLPALFVLGCYQSSTKQPIVRQGLLDLSGNCQSNYNPNVRQEYTNSASPARVETCNHWDFAKQDVLNLKGEWKFYKQVLYQPTSISNDADLKTEYVPVPSYWNKYAKNIGGPMHPMSFGTYRLTLILPDDSPRLYLRIPEMHSAFKIYINNKLHTEVGKVGTQRSDSTGEFRPVVLELPDNRRLDLIFQISNFQVQNGGFRRAMQLGTRHQIQNLERNSIGLTLFLCGALFIIGLYHLLLFIFKHDDHAILYFAIFSFLINMRLLVTGERFLQSTFPGAPFWLMHRLEIIPLYMGAAIFVAYFQHLFPGTLQKQVRQFFYATGLLTTLAALILPAHISTHLLLYQEILIIACGGYILFTSVRAIIAKREGALLFLSGFVFLFTAIVHDILRHEQNLHGPITVPYGLLLFFLAQSIMLSHRIARAFRSLKTVTVELHASNSELTSARFTLEKIVRSLEVQVQERTAEIQTQNQDLEKHAAELQESIQEIQILNKFKDKLMALIAHELRGPVWRIQLMIDLLLRKDLDEESIKEFLSVSRASIGHTYTFLDNLLNWALSQQGLLKYNPEYLDIKEIQISVFDLFKSMADEKGIRLQASLRDQSKVYADREMLKLILRNLVSNAIKFTPAGGSVKFSMQRNPESVQLIVSDSGLGMDAVALEQLRNPSVRFTTPGTDDERGTGFGSLLVAECIKTSQANLEIRSEPDKGSQFIITLPAAAASL